MLTKVPYEWHVKALVSDKKSVYNKVEARKTILEIGLYLSVLDATCVAINTINSIGFSAYYIIVNNFKHKIANEHSLNIRKFLSEHVSGCAPIPIIFNNVSVHNLVNIDASNKLIQEYHGIFDIAYTKALNGLD
ncbi:16409_t:CDS:2 [Rhizophagus irregularis]|nr:16409_t:CDS:2 [Rhizophagus irregularis]